MKKHSKTIPLSGSILLVFVCLIWGGNMVAIKFSNQGVPPLLAATVRSILAATFLLVLAAALKQRVWPRRRDVLHALVIGALFGLDFLFLYWGTAFTTASRAVIFLYTHPFWVALGAHFVLHDDRLSAPKSAGLVLAFVGMASVFTSGGSALPPGYWIGDLMEVAAAMFWGATTLYIKRAAGGPGGGMNHYQTLFSQLLFSVPVLAAGWFFLEIGRPVALGRAVLLALGYQCLIVAFFSYVLWFWMIHTYPVSRLAAFTFLTPLFGAVLGGLLMGDSLPPLLWLGLALIACGIYLVNRPEGERKTGLNNG